MSLEEVRAIGRVAVMGNRGTLVKRRSLLPPLRTHWVAPGLSFIGRGLIVDSTSATDFKSQSTAISNSIGSLHCEHYRRGADRIRTLFHQDIVVTTLEDCFTTVAQHQSRRSS
jgi:hypothetical protein